MKKILRSCVKDLLEDFSFETDKIESKQRVKVRFSMGHVLSVPLYQSRDVMKINCLSRWSHCCRYWNCHLYLSLRLAV